MNKIDLFGITAIILILTSCKLKTKTELYLERDLDILSNKKNVNFQLNNQINIREIGVIRDRKNQTKTIVFSLNNPVISQNLEGCILEMEAEIKEEGNKPIRIENWDFKPHIVEVNGNNYILGEIYLEEDKIQRMRIYLNCTADKNARVESKVLTIEDLYTYND